MIRLLRHVGIDFGKRYFVTSSFVSLPRGVTVRRSLNPLLAVSAPVVDNVEEIKPGDSMIVERTLPNGKPKSTAKIMDDVFVLLKDRRIEETLDFASKNAELLMSEHVYRCFGNIHRDLVAMSTTDASGVKDFDNVLDNVRNDARFVNLCILAGKKASYLDAIGVAYMIKYLVNMKFDSESTLVRLFLQLAKYHVNDLNMTRVSYLGHYLTKLEETDEVLLLKRLLAAKVDIDIYHQCKFLDTHTFVNLLEAYGELVELKTLKFLTDNLLLRKDSSKFYLPDVILKSLAKVKDRHSHEGLVYACVDLSEEFIKRDELSLSQVYDVISALSDLRHYSHSTFQLAVDFLNSNNAKLSTQIQFLDKFVSCGYCPVSLVENVFASISSFRKDEFENLTYDCKLKLGKIYTLTFNTVNVSLPVTLLNDNVVNILVDEDLKTRVTNDYSPICRNLQLLDSVVSVEADKIDKNLPGFILKTSDNLTLKILIFEDTDIFHNLACLKSPWQRVVNNLRERNESVFAISYTKFRNGNKHDMRSLIGGKVLEALNSGYTDML